jgi:hypothetical protein
MISKNIWKSVIGAINWLSSSIRSKVSLLDTELKSDNTKPKPARRNLSKSQSMLDRLEVWERENGVAIQKAIDNSKKRWYQP